MDLAGVCSSDELGSEGERCCVVVMLVIVRHDCFSFEAHHSIHLASDIWTKFLYPIRAGRLILY